MNNIENMLNHPNKNVKLFARAVYNLKDSQGFYSRIYNATNEWDPEHDEEYANLINQLEEQSFNDELDVVLWLEQ